MVRCWYADRVPHALETLPAAPPPSLAFGVGASASVAAQDPIKACSAQAVAGLAHAAGAPPLQPQDGAGASESLVRHLREFFEPAAWKIRECCFGVVAGASVGVGASAGASAGADPTFTQLSLSFLRTLWVERRVVLSSLGPTR